MQVLYNLQTKEIFINIVFMKVDFFYDLLRFII